MLEVYFGNDTVRVREEALKALEKRRAKGAALETLSLENFQPGILTDAAAGSSLFGGETVYLIDTPSENSDTYDAVIAHLSELAESIHTFVVIEKTLLVAEKKKFSKHAEVIEEFKSAAAKRFNTFAMADALAKKDKRTLWLLLSEAREEGIADEEVIGILWWQLKALRLAETTKTAAEAGMKDFPYNKAKRSLQGFKEGELSSLSQSLLNLYHNARAGKTDMSTALEQWTLTLK